MRNLIIVALLLLHTMVVDLRMRIVCYTPPCLFSFLLRLAPSSLLLSLRVVFCLDMTFLSHAYVDH